MAKRCLVVVPILGVIIGLTSSLAAQSADTIIKREEARIAAIRSGQGREQFYSRDYIGVSPSGVVVLGYQPPAKPNPAIYIKDIKVLTVAKNGAVVTSLQGPRPATSPLAGDGPDRFLHVWANEEGTWRLVARQGIYVQPSDTGAPRRIKAPSVAAFVPKGADEAEIYKTHVAIEDAFTRHDGTAYDRLTLPEFVRIGGNGQMASKAEWIKASVIGDPKVARVIAAFDDVRIRVYGDVAVMTHRHISRNTDGTTPVQPQRLMRAWVRRNDGWKLAATTSAVVLPTQETRK
jgi:hypothetical protein